ncbi:hypothetical protein HZB02_07505 [Candidatus Woesearchaeota archaeon]|nr:hypothetical protein [Candidatus Woesearchaeota archaeon]
MKAAIHVPLNNLPEMCSPEIEAQGKYQLTITKNSKTLSFTITAEDLASLRVGINSVLKQLIIYEKVSSIP